MNLRPLSFVVSHPAARPRRSRQRDSLRGIYATAWILVSSLCALHGFCQAQQARISLCNEGIGQFASKFSTGVTVTVGAQKVSGFASHACSAALTWGKSELPVTAGAAEVDIDVMGADLGLGKPVVAFQIRSAAADAQMSYQVYSLEQPPRLLRAVTGGDFYSAADTDLDSRIEIWTGDALAADGLEGLPITGFDFPPTVVLRFEKDRLMDVSAEFAPDYDRQIAKVRALLSAQALSDFKNSDALPMGRSSLPSGRQLKLLATKIKVLEIVLDYLYSGRDQDAWAALAAMWPAPDVDRIRSALLAAQARGIRKQVDGVATPVPGPRHQNAAYVYDLVHVWTPMAGSMGSGAVRGRGRFSYPAAEDPSPSRGVLKPAPIFMLTPEISGGKQNFPATGLSLELTVDAAGKVRTAKMVNAVHKGPIVDSLLGATSAWKFIPATKDHHPVACNFRLSVSPAR